MTVVVRLSRLIGEWSEIALGADCELTFVTKETETEETPGVVSECELEVKVRGQEHMIAHLRAVVAQSAAVVVDMEKRESASLAHIERMGASLRIAQRLYQAAEYASTHAGEAKAQRLRLACQDFARAMQILASDREAYAER